jgi:hypothetical protein
LPVGGLAIFLLFVFFRTPAAVKPVPIKTKDFFLTMDIPSVTLCMGLLISLTIAMQKGGTSKPWSSSEIIGLLVGFAVMTILFGVLQWLSGERGLLVPRILKQRTVAAVSTFIFL